MLCSDCGLDFDKESLINVDGKPICVDCLYGEAEPVLIRPIGFVANDKERVDKAFGTTGGDISDIHLCPGMARFMKGLSDESHLTILWHAHQSRSVKTVFSRGWDGKSVGPFASRTPDRLTPIGVSEVELLNVKGTMLKVRGLDAVNGTPVLDIKVSLKSLKRSDKPKSAE